MTNSSERPPVEIVDPTSPEMIARLAVLGSGEVPMLREKIALALSYMLVAKEYIPDKEAHERFVSGVQQQGKKEQPVDKPFINGFGRFNLH